MYKSRRRVIPLTEADEIVVELGFDPPGKLIDASVDYHAAIRGRWKSVIRYDNAHGIAHVHRAWLDRPAKVLPARTTPTRLLNLAMADLLSNWHVYRSKLEARP